MAVVKFEEATKYYGATCALNKCNFTIPSGKIIGLLGPNGSGKSTIIKLCSGLIPLTSGKITVDDLPVGIESKKKISYLPERTFFDTSKTVNYYIKLFKDFYDDFDENKALSQLSKFDINPKNRISTLSKGNREKVQLILVMSRNAELYILDEPISGVDPLSRDIILDIIMDNFNPESTLLISTHLIQDIERLLDEVIFIARGKIILQEEADKLREEYEGSIDKAFREVFRCL